MKKTVATVICAIFFACSMLPSLVVAEEYWSIQVVDEDISKVGAGFCPIVLDSEGNPHIAYSGAPMIRYTSWNGSGWDIQLIAYGGLHDLVLDENDTPHITFERLYYARWNGTDWKTRRVSADYALHSSLALDSSGNPHIAYNSGHDLKYASWNGTNWNTQTVDTGVKIFVYHEKVSLVLDQNNTPHILYYAQSSSGNVKLAVWKNSTWDIQSVPALPHLDALGNMVMDSKGILHFICAQTPNEDQYYIMNILHVSGYGTDWNIQTVVSNVSLANIGFLALDSYDRPNICYITRGTAVVYTRWMGTSWENYTVDKNEIVQRPSCLALDSNDNPHISYYKVASPEVNDMKLMYATANLTKYPPPEPLNVSIVSPENRTYATDEVQLTFTLSKQLSSICYSVDDEANVSVTGNTTLTDLEDGAHKLTVYAKDNDQNTTVSETVHFTTSKQGTEPTQTFPDLPILLASVAVAVGAVVAVVYVLKKKSSKIKDKSSVGGV